MSSTLETQTSYSDNLFTLASWMAGEFSNYDQARKNPKIFAHIHIYFRPLPFEFFEGIGFYSEQVFDYDLWSPYRQGVHRLIDQGHQIYVENYSLNNSIYYAGAARDLNILKTIKPEAIQRRFHCSMIFVKNGEKYIGGVEPGNLCLINKNGHQTYLQSFVELTETTWISLDKGMDICTHEQVWGSTLGTLNFQKCQSFSHELLVK